METTYEVNAHAETALDVVLSDLLALTGRVPDVDASVVGGAG